MTFTYPRREKVDRKIEGRRDRLDKEVRDGMMGLSTHTKALPNQPLNVKSNATTKLVNEHRKSRLLVRLRKTVV